MMMVMTMIMKQSADIGSLDKVRRRVEIDISTLKNKTTILSIAFIRHL